MCSESTPLGDN